MRLHEWHRFKEELDQSRVTYAQEHLRLKSSGFGTGYDFEIKKFRQNKSEYLMTQLETLDERQNTVEERFNELHKFLG